MDLNSRTRPRIRVGAVVFALLVLVIQQGHAADKEPENAPLIKEIRSKNFIVHTDLSAAKSKPIIQRMERAVGIARRFWGKSLNARVECYLIDDLSKWTSFEFPNDDAAAVIEYVGGGTDVEKVTSKRRRVSFKPLIYSTTQFGIAEHEAVHAYCVAAFGETGPEWFREGMAEMASYGSGTAKIQCPKSAFKNLAGKHRSLIDIVSGDTFAKPLNASLAKTSQPEGADPNVPPTGWSNTDTLVFDNARAANCWSWALCHMLYHNPNYRKRFEMFGRNQISTADCQFWKAFGPASKQIDFELRHFIEHAGPGFRVDLCRWDWSGKKKQLSKDESTRTNLQARRGFQSVGVQLEKNAEYRISIDGDWSVHRNETVDASECDKDAPGGIEAIAMKNFQLSDPWVANNQSTFVAQKDGTLHLRCQEDWNALADNSGHVVVRVTRIR